MAEKPKDSKKVKRPTAQKRHAQDERKRMQNKSYRSSAKTALKTFIASLNQNDMAKKMQSFGALASLVDKGVNRGIFKHNKASRIKARMSVRLQASA